MRTNMICGAVMVILIFSLFVPLLGTSGDKVSAEDVEITSAEANLSLSAWAPEHAYFYDSFPLSIYVYNEGDTAAENVELVAMLSDHAVFDYASDVGAYSYSEHKVTWGLGSIPAVDGRYVEVLLHCEYGFGPLDVVENQAAASTVTPEYNYGDNQASTFTLLWPWVQLDLFKNAPASAWPGSQITYSLEYHDLLCGVSYYDPYCGWMDPGTVVIVDTLPENVEFLSASDGGTYADGQVTWGLEYPLDSCRGEVTVTVKVADDASIGSNLYNKGEVWGPHSDIPSDPYWYSEAVTTIVDCDTTIVVDAPDEVTEGSDFIADVAVDCVENVNSCQFDVTYDETVITVTDVTGGEIDGHALEVGPGDWSYIPAGSDPGRIRVIASVPGTPAPGVTGTGYIAQIHYHVSGSVCSTSDIHLENLAMYDYQANSIATTTVDDSVHVAFPSLEILAGAWPEGELGDPYVVSMNATGGKPPYAFAATGLPAGLSCSSAGVISGTPTEVGHFTVTATVIDILANSDSTDRDVTVSCKIGDANMDGVVDTGDITKVKRIYFGLDDPTPCADVNGDCFIDPGDITASKLIYFAD